MIYEFDATSDVAESYRRGWEDGHSAAGRSGIAAFVTGFLLASLIGIALFVALLVAPAAASRSALESSPVEEAGFRAAQGPTEVPSPGGISVHSPAPTVEDGVGEPQTEIGTALEAGIASWCAPTPTHCQSWGGNSKLGAVPTFRYGDQPYTVRVCRQDNDAQCVTVTVVSFCDCGDKVIDLSPSAFRQLAPLSRGIVAVTVETGGPSVTPPATDSEGSR